MYILFYVIGTIYWHEVITCEHLVSLDQKCSFILTASHSLDKSCMAEFSTLGFISSMTISASISSGTFLFFCYCALLVDSQLKWKTASLLGLVRIFCGS